MARDAQNNGDLAESIAQALRSHEDLVRDANTCPGFDAVAELQHALAHAREFNFGRTRHTLRPLSKQVFDEVRSLFPIDKPAFDEADKLKSKITRRTLQLRACTMGVFCLWVMAVAVLTHSFLDARGVQWTFLTSFPAGVVAYIGWLLAISILATAARRGIRAWFFMSIHQATGQFSHDLDSRWDDVNTRVTDCCLEAQSRGKGWALRSKLYLIIAVWNSKRAEYLDRYTTVLGWKINDIVRRIEQVATSAKALIAAALILTVLGRVAADAELQTLRILAAIAALLLVVPITTIWGFLLFGRVPNDKWTEVLRSDIAKSESTHKHNFLKLGELVENLARTILEVQRTPDDPPPSAQSNVRRPLEDSGQPD